MIGSLRRALRGLREHAYLAAVSTGVITAALLLLGVYGLVVGNIQSVVSGWKQDVHVSAYFVPTATKEEQEAAKAAMSGRPEVEGVEWVTSDAAAAWMKERVPEVDPMLAELGNGALPASLEITLKHGSTGPEAMDAFVASVKESAAFSDVDYGREWVERSERLLGALHAMGLAFGAILTVAALFLVGNTIHLAVFARRDELEILRLVGATDGWILTPFVIEGALEGLVAALLALGALVAAQEGLGHLVSGALPSGFAGGATGGLPAGWALGLLILGVAIGVTAATVAVRRFLGRLS